MNKGIERVLLVVLGLLLAVRVVNEYLGIQTSLLIFDGLWPFTLVAIMVCFYGCLRFYLKRRADEELREQLLEQSQADSSTLFDESSLSPLTMRRTLRQEERYGVPLFCTILATFLGFCAWNLVATIRSPQVPLESPNWLVIIFFLMGESFLFFLLSRYLLGLSRHPGYVLARGPGVYVGLVSMAAAAGGIAALAGHLDFPVADTVVAIVFAVLLGTLTLELVLLLVFTLYSPRRGEAMAEVYHSRIGGLITDPAGWVRNFAHAIDYQFGFNLSETWIYRTLQRMVIPLILSLAGVLYLMSCFVFIQPEEQAVRERFGKPLASGWKLDSGFHLKAPWPIETVRRVPANRILTTTVGYTLEEGEERPEYLLWTQQHFRQGEDPMLLASRPVGANSAEQSSPFGLLLVNVPVEYRITDLHRYLYHFTSPDTIIQRLCRKVLVQELAGRDVNEMLLMERHGLSDSLKETIQVEIDAVGLGVGILFVGLQGIHPPTDVAEAYQSVVASLEEKETAILEAEAYAARLMPTVEAEAETLRLAAETYSANQILQARAEAEQFTCRLGAYRNSPEVYRTEAYLAMLRRTLGGVRKYIIDKSPGSAQVINFDFQEKLNPDIFDLPDLTQEGASSP